MNTTLQKNILAHSPSKLKHLTILSAIALNITLPLHALELNLLPTQDASIYSESDSLADSQGPHLFAGQTKSGHDQSRRALLSFNPSSLPLGAILLSAELRLFIDNSPFAAPSNITFDLHPIQEFWQEGSSNAGNPGGLGAPASTNDPTWLHAAYSNALWSTAGGSISTSSAQSTGDFTAGDTISFSSPQMINDIQQWINTPASNFGWMILGDESLHKSARRFASSENTLDPSPQLILTYQIPEPNSALLLLLGGILLARHHRR